MLLKLDRINIDERTQSRANLDLATIAEYAEAMRAGAQFPVIVVFFDGAIYWLADGFHRVYAALQAGLVSLAAEVRQGDRRAAILYSVGANATHGLRRTHEDKRRAVMALLTDSEWGRWSDAEIARQTNTSHPFVGKLRRHLETFQDGPRLVRRGDSVYEMDTGKIGHLSEAECRRLADLEGRIEASLKQMGQMAGELRQVKSEMRPDQFFAWLNSVDLTLQEATALIAYDTGDINALMEAIYPILERRLGSFSSLAESRGAA